MAGSPLFAPRTCVLGVLTGLVVASMLLMIPVAGAQETECENVQYNDRVVFRCVTTNDDGGGPGADGGDPESEPTPGTEESKPPPSADEDDGDDDRDDRNDGGEGTALSDFEGRGGRLTSTTVPEPEAASSGAADSTTAGAQNDNEQANGSSQSETGQPASASTPPALSSADAADSGEQPAVRPVLAIDVVGGPRSLPILVGAVVMTTIGTAFWLSARRVRNRPVTSGSDQRTRG